MCNKSDILNKPELNVYILHIFFGVVDYFISLLHEKMWHRTIKS